MRSFYIILGLILLFNIQVLGQCVPNSNLFNSNLNNLQISPDTAVFNNTGTYFYQTGVNYSIDFNIKTFTDTALGGLAIKVKQVKFVGFEGLPNGSTFSTDQPNNTWTNSGVYPQLNPVVGCVNLSIPASSLQFNTTYQVVLKYDLFLTIAGQDTWYSALTAPLGTGDYLRKTGYSLKEGSPLPIPEICMVTVDTTSGFNQVIWNEDLTFSYYKVYRQNTFTGNFDSISIVPTSNLSSFLDLGSVPNQQSNSYKISAVDFNGIESQQSPIHTSIHLSASSGVGGEANLIWNSYIGFTYSNFQIYRQNNGGAFSLIGSTSNNSTSYSDLNPPLGTNNYLIAVSNPNGCNPSKSITKSMSNVVDGSGNPVFINESKSTFFTKPKVLINKDLHRLEILSIDNDLLFNARLIDMFGNSVNTHKKSNYLYYSNEASGVYILLLESNNDLNAIKVVLD